MKQFTLTLLFTLMPLMASADSVEIDGICYNLVSKAKMAEVTNNSGNYSGAIIIPEKVTYDGKEYSVTSIGEYAFYSCTDLTVTIPNSVTNIGSSAFRGCSGLTSVTIGNSVTSIGDYVFGWCTGLTSVTIPNSVTSIGDGAFSGCTDLTFINVEEGNTKYDSRENCNAIIETSSNTLIAGCKNSTIPGSVASIGDYAFESCSGLTSITIPNSVASIGDYAFESCSGLTSITIPSCVTSIGEGAFQHCSLTSITIPNSVTSIGEYAFSFCTGLTSVTIPNSVTSIGNSAFNRCSGLTSITIPNSVTTIGNSAFEVCSGLTSITIPNSVTSIGNDAFYGCSGLTSITIPNSVTSIGEAAFCSCPGLTSITIPNSVTSIGKSAFLYCSGLTSITIGNSVTSIGDNAFNVKNIAEIVSLIETPFKISSSAFSENTRYNATLYVPKGTLEKYKTTAGWNHFEIIVEAEDANTFTENGIYYQLMSDGTLEVTGLSSSTTRADIPSSLTINGTKYSVTSIGESAFEGRSDITFLSIQYSMRSIGKNAFRNCGNNITVNIANLESWCKMELGNEYASPLSCAGKVLLYDVETTSVNIPEAITSIGKYTFYGCRSITSLSISGNVTSIGSSAFEDCIGLTSINLSTGLTSIGGSAFEGCTGLSAITIPSTVSEILINAFQGCSNLKNITSKIKSPFAIDSNTFSTYTTATLTVPYSTKSAYMSTSGWNRFSNIVEDDSGQPIIVTANSYSREYGEANPSFNYTTSGADLKGTPTISCDATKTSPVGTYTIKISKGNETNGNVTYVDGTLIITKAPLTVTAKNCSREQGQANPTFELTYSGFKNNESEDVLTRKPTASTTATTSSTPGQYIITVSGGEARNYDFKYVSGILTVTEKDEVAFTIDGTTYQGIKTDKTVIVKSVDINMKSLEIPASVSYDGTTYQVTGIADNFFDGSNMAALIWNLETVLPNNAFSNASIGANFLLYVKSSSYAPSSVKNVVVNGTASLIQLSDDGGQFYCPQAFTARSISYTHNYSMETGGNGKGWETLALPFDVQKITHSTRGEIVPFPAYNSSSNQKPFWLANFSGSGFRRTSAVLANEPYIIAMPNSSNYRNEYNLAGDVTFSSENVQVPKTPSFSGSFLPAYATVPKTAKVYALNVNNRFVKYSGSYDAGSCFISGLREVRPFEAYIYDSSTRGVIEINFDVGTTDNDDILLSADEDQEVTIHNLSGQQVTRTTQHDFDQVWSDLPKGVYIVNGKKYIK